MKHIYLILVLIDMAVIFTNVKTGLVYTISEVLIDDVFKTWTVSFGRFFYFHLILCYLVSLTSGVILMRSILKEYSGNRKNYVALLFLFLVVLFSNGTFIFLSEQFVFDYSAVILGLLLIIVFNYTNYTIPKYLAKNILVISSENVSDAIICFDEEGKFVYGNKLARTFFSNTEHEKEWAASYMESKSDFLTKTETVEFDGEKRTFKVEFRRLRDYKNRNCGCYIKLKECTREILSIEREAYRASHDEMTGLYNRDFFFKEMARILKAEPDVPRYLVSTDIKDFKLVNELFGSDFGDRILIRQAEMLKKADYPGVIRGRISGDRYAMLIPQDKYNPELASKNSSKIIELENEINFKLTIYIGVYEITDPTENVHTMYDKASSAIKNATLGPHQNIVYYDTDLMNKLLLEKTIVNEFDKALEMNQFEMFLQPQIELKTGKCVGAEALVRWNHPEKGYIGPLDFIKALEKSDQINRLDYYMWNLAAKKLSEWKKQNIDAHISVNISSKDFYYENLFDYFKELVEKYNISPEKLNLEITESVVINDKNMHKSVLDKLKEYGFKIEMDDFGSGYSSLNVLKDISMDVLKLDMGFLRKADDVDRAKSVILSVVKMAKLLNMEIISEGVENQEQADLLADFGVDVVQGYLYSKPIPVDEFEKKYLEVE